MRRYDCHPVPLGALRVSLAPPSPLLASHVRGLRVRLVTRWKPPGHARAFGPPVPRFRHVSKETGGSPTCPSSPSEDMPRSQTPVVSWALAIAYPGLLPSSAGNPSAYHDYTHFGAHSRGLPSRDTRLRTAPYGEARGFAPDLLARRESGGTCTRCAPTGKQQPIAWSNLQSQGFGLTLARATLC